MMLQGPSNGRVAAPVRLTPRVMPCQPSVMPREGETHNGQLHAGQGSGRRHRRRPRHRPRHGAARRQEAPASSSTTSAAPLAARAATPTPAEQVVDEIKQGGRQGRRQLRERRRLGRRRETSSSARWTSFGQLDGVVNNAGILRDLIFHKMSEEDWDAVIDVHLNGSFNVSRAAANHFKRAGVAAPSCT